jgi:hypothetical protein
MRRRAIGLILSALLSILPPGAGLALAAATAPVAPAVTADSVAVNPKVVIVVGATQDVTSTYRADADLVYNEAIQYTPNVVRVYSPNATLASVEAAAQGASILVYLGHGSGFPGTSSSVFDPSHADGMGLNYPTNPSDANTRYYGETYMAKDLHLAKNAVVILAHLCYASGNSQPGDPEPTLAVAEQRVDNYASGFLRAGARAVIADTWNSGAVAAVHGLLATHQTIGQMWHSMPSEQGHEVSFAPERNPAYSAIVDPTEVDPYGQFYRSIVGNLDLTTDDVMAGAAAPATNAVPDSLVAPGAAVVGAAGIDVYDDAGLTSLTGMTLPAGTAVRVDDLVAGTTADDGTTTPTAVEVQTLDGAASGWVDGSGLLPRDSTAPELWSVDGPVDISPNGDGVDDSLNLVATFSENANWQATVTDPAGATLATMSGGSHQAFISWDPVGDGVAPPDGTYGWTVHATDPWDNPSLDASGSFTVSDASVSPTSVVVDQTAPTSTAPLASLRSDVRLSSASTKVGLPVLLSWSGTDGSGSGIVSYDLAKSINGGAWQIMATGLDGTSRTVALTAGKSYRFRIRAHDAAGNVGAWATGPTLRPTLVQNTAGSLSWRGTWHTTSSSIFSGGSVRFSKASGASVSYAFSGSSVALVTTTASTRGQVKVYLDGTYVTTVDLASPAYLSRTVAWSQTWSSRATHTLKLVVVGTAGRPRIDLDAVAVLR